MQPIVIDTNVVLDAFMFADVRTARLRACLVERSVRWLATAPMREELSRVLAYPHIVRRLLQYELKAEGVLEAFDRHAEIAQDAAVAPALCRDPDDQKFIDLAVAHAAILVSKDREVLRMKSKLASLGCPSVAAIY
ncbi:putative toxin-antitoxin system toxin component, PIN family [Ramlibacter sp.]|uniref:putative toxin-antitoxin system toxin component, PIN family n=1 Tax=Ramlibacter sp. TaxID=1917967 RepID=UPI003D0A6018